jgi:modulator of FtsH protease
VDGLNPQAWRDFFTVAGTAGAALLGLVLVAISLHVEKVEGHPLLRNRARGSLQTLGLILVLSLAALVPQITALWFGVVTLVVEAAGLGLLIWGLWIANRQAGRLPLGVWLRSVPNALILLTIAAGISLTLGKGPGIYLMAPQFILVLPAMLFSVWSLLFAPELQARQRESTIT